MDFSKADDPKIFDWIRKSLYVAAVCDILDTLHFRNQAMHQRLRPLDPENCTIVGRARTFRWMDVDHVPPSDPYGSEIEAMDSLRAGDVVVHSTDYGGTNAQWGELMSTAAKARGAVGSICDSQIRDCLKIKRLGFPVFHQGIRPLDSMGRAKLMQYDVPVRCGEVLVHPGELVFADFDGVVVIPRQVERQALELAAEKAGKEDATRADLMAGKTLREVFDKYKVL